MPTISTKVEAARGCGYRKAGGIYMVSDGIGVPCCSLPFELTVCPCCHAGIKQSRGFTWISSKIFGDILCKDFSRGCPLSFLTAIGVEERVGLMWVGEKYYPTSDHFSKEANFVGVSKRIAALPKDFKVGETWVMLAYPKAISKINDKGEITFAKGIFRAFKPERIEYVVKDDDSDEKLDKLEKRGFTLVKVIRDIDAQLKLESVE